MQEEAKLQKRSKLAKVLDEMGVTKPMVTLGTVLYKNARRRGLGVRRAFYVVLHALGIAVKRVAYVLDRSVNTIWSQLKKTFRQFGINSRGELAPLFSEPVPRESWCAPKKRPRDHPVLAERSERHEVDGQRGGGLTDGG